MRRLIPLLCSLALVLAAADCGGDARADTPPPIKGVGAVSLFVAGDTITGTWTYKAPGLFATDTAKLTWSQKALGTSSWTSLGTTPSRGTAASKVIPAVTTGDSVRLCIVVNRVGTTPSPTVCAQKGRAPAPSGGVDSLTLSVRSIIVRPDSAKVYAVVAGKPVTDSNRVQFCAAARLSDDSVILTSNSEAVGVCRTMFAGLVGFRLSSSGVRVFDRGLPTIHIEGGEYLVSGRTGPQHAERLPEGANLTTPSQIFQWVKPTIDGAFHMGGEWWLAEPLPVQSVS